MASHKINQYLNKSYQDEESIYKLLPHEPIKLIKPAKYHSRYPSQIDPTGSTFGHQSTTKPYTSNLAGDFYSPDYGHQRRNRCISFGTPVAKIQIILQKNKIGQSQNSPTCFLRKGYGNQIGTINRLPHINNSINKNEVSFQSALNQSYIENNKCCHSRNPSVPRRDESPITIQPEKKSFVYQNIIQSILSSPPEQQSPINWLQKKAYGRIPQYLTRIKEQTKNEYDALKNFIDQEEQIQKNQKYLLPQDELEKLKQGLKERWTELNQEYQKTTHKKKIDGISKIQQRIDLEKQLAQIEEDLKILNKQTVIVDSAK